MDAVHDGRIDGEVPSVASLAAELAIAEAERNARTAEALDAVVRWEWAAGPDRSFEPHWFELNRQRPGRRIAAPAHPRPGMHSYGVDALGRTRVVRIYGGGVWDGLDTFDEEVCTYDALGVSWARYAHAPGTECLAVNRLRLVDGAPAWLVRCGRAGGSVTRWHREGGRVVRIDVEAEEPGHADPQRRRWTATYHLRWDPLGLVGIVTDGKDREVPVWRRPEGAVTGTAFVAALEEAIYEAVRARLAAFVPDDEVFAVALAYDGEGAPLPPLLGIGLARDRTALLAGPAEQLATRLWNPAGWSVFDVPALALDDASMVDVCDRHCQELTARGSLLPAVRMLGRVAARLRAEPPPSLRLTDDAVVYVVDVEASAIRAGLRDALPKERFTAWKRQGWVP